jgi:carbonic anhydrase
MKARIELSEARSSADYEAARALFIEYAEWLGVDLSFQDFSDELEHLPQMYGPPSGCLLLGRDGAASAVVACVGVRRLSAETCEMKRLFVAESARGRGVGGRLALEAVRAGARLGYSRMVLDTLDRMVAARQIYASLGFEKTEPYYLNPLAGAEFMALDLRSWRASPRASSV